MLENLKETYIDDELWEDLFYHIGKEFVEFYKDEIPKDEFEHEWDHPSNFAMIRDEAGDGIGFYHAMADKMYLTK